VPVSQPAATASVARTAGLAESTVGDALQRLRAAGFVEGGVSGWRLTPAG
jgi:DNA-binding IclR family transcriptional regulator